MPVDDLWYLTKRGPDDRRLPSKRHGRGKRWRVRWNDDAGLPRQQLFEKKTDADRHDAAMRADVSRGVYVDPSAGKTTVSAYGRQWRATVLHRDSTAEMVERAFRLHIDPIIGGRSLAAIRPSHLQAWVKDRAGALEPSTLRVVYSYLVSMFGAALRDRLIGISPCMGIRLPEVARQELFIPAVDRVHAAAEEIPRRYRALVYTAAGTGVRQGEAWGLELEHVDFLRRELHVVQQLKSVSGRPPFLAPVKTPTSRRTLELGTVLTEELARHIELFPPAEVEIDDETDPRRPVRRTAKLIFLNGIGRPIVRGSWSYVWIPAVERAGLPKGFGFHGLRHYFATLLIHSGASVKTVQMALGHSTPTVTLNTYIGQWPEAVDRTRAIVDAALSRSAAGPALAVVR